VDRRESLPVSRFHFFFLGYASRFLIRRILSSQWDEATWPIAKHELTKALKLRALLDRAGWWN
jgi:hypothetical protein